VTVGQLLSYVEAPGALFLARMSGLPLRGARPRARGQPQTTGGMATLPLKAGGRLGAVWGSIKHPCSATIVFTLVGELAGPGGKPNDISGRSEQLSH
jgi:hypothetical protein